MSDVSFDVTYAEQRDRLTTAFRFILAIPHYLIASVWAYLAELLAVVQWFIILFTGRRNESVWNLQRAWLGYAARVYGYIGLLFDKWPAIGPEPQGEPTSFEFRYEPEANRLSNALRIFWLIPAAIVLVFIIIAAYFVAIVSWFAIVITGRHPRGMWDFMLRSQRNYLRFTAYALLMTDTYPWFRGDEPTSVGTTPPPYYGQSMAGSPLPPPASPPVA
jgi:Domain of unknown function (DUF4389)